MINSFRPFAVSVTRHAASGPKLGPCVMRDGSHNSRSTGSHTVHSAVPPSGKVFEAGDGLMKSDVLHHAGRAQWLQSSWRIRRVWG